MNPMNQEPINMFYFNAEFIKNIRTGFKVNPIDFDHASNPVNMSVNAVHYGNPRPTSPPPFPIPIPLSPTLSPTVPNSKPIRPCNLCVYKNFDATHFPLSEECGVRKLSLTDIIKIIDITRSCPSCGSGHSITYQCKTTFYNGHSLFCAKGCKHYG